MQDSSEQTPKRPSRFPDAGAYPTERDPQEQSVRAIDCSAAHAARIAESRAKAGEGGSAADNAPVASAER